MDCPLCHIPLMETAYEGAKVFHCDQCDGFWLDDEALRHVINTHEKRFTAEQIEQAIEEIEKKPILSRSVNEKSVVCPQCGATCDKISHNGVVIDECSERHGIWLDKGELEKLQVLAEERSRIFTEDRRGKLPEEEDSHGPRGALFILDQFGVFLHRALKRRVGIWHQPRS